MLRTFSDLTRMSIGATEGEIGSVKDAYFDDHEWTLRYLVVATGSWLTGAQVLLTPLALRGVDWSNARLDVNLTREQIRNAPGIETDKPVSRQHEIAYYDHYGYPYYWSGPFMWGPVAFPAGAGAPTGGPDVTLGQTQRRERAREKGDPNLRSANEVSGYHIEANDGAIGHVEDYLFDDVDWSLRYFIVDTRNWLPGRKVLISTDWVDRVSWDDRKAYVALLRDEVRNSPEYDRSMFTEAEEEELYRHYGRTPLRTPVQAQIR